MDKPPMCGPNAAYTFYHFNDPCNPRAILHGPHYGIRDVIPIIEGDLSLFGGGTTGNPPTGIALTLTRIPIETTR